MYCRASATPPITSASRITLTASPSIKTNWAANLPTRGLSRVANPLQSAEIGDLHAACEEIPGIERLEECLAQLGHPVRDIDLVQHLDVDLSVDRPGSRCGLGPAAAA